MPQFLHAMNRPASRMSAGDIVTAFGLLASRREPVSHVTYLLLQRTVELLDDTPEPVDRGPGRPCWLSRALSQVLSIYVVLHVRGLAVPLSSPSHQHTRGSLTLAVGTRCMELDSYSRSSCLRALSALQWKHQAAATRIVAAVDAEVGSVTASEATMTLSGFAYRVAISHIRATAYCTSS